MRKTKNDEVQLVNYTIRLPLDIHTKCKTKLAAERKNMRDIIMPAIMDYISKKNKNPK